MDSNLKKRILLELKKYEPVTLKPVKEINIEQEINRYKIECEKLINDPVQQIYFLKKLSSLYVKRFL